MSVVKFNTRVHTVTGNPIKKYESNFIFWNDFQTMEVDFTTGLSNWATMSSDTDLTKLLYAPIDQTFIDRYTKQYEGLILNISGQDRYIVRFELGKVVLNSVLSSSASSVMVQFRYVANIKNKATNSFRDSGIASANLRVINNAIYGKKGYTIRCNASALPTQLYTIPSSFSLITKYQQITDQSANWQYPPGDDSGNGGILFSKNTTTNYATGTTNIGGIAWDGQTTVGLRNNLNSPLAITNTYATQKFAPKVFEKDSLGYRFYWENTKYIINSTNQGTIIDRSIHPYVQFAVWQFNGNPDGRFQELSYMFILGNAESLNEKELNKFMAYLKVAYNR